MFTLTTRVQRRLVNFFIFFDIVIFSFNLLLMYVNLVHNVEVIFHLPSLLKAFEFLFEIHVAVLRASVIFQKRFQDIVSS